MAKRLLPCQCDPDPEYPLRRMAPSDFKRALQGGLKELPANEYARLKAEMELYGFRYPVFVWWGHDEVIDGERRLSVLEGENWDVEGGIPVVSIQATSALEAAQAVLACSSAYGIITETGLADFMERHGLGVAMLGSLKLPDFDADAFLRDHAMQGELGAELDESITNGLKPQAKFIVVSPTEHAPAIKARLEALAAEFVDLVVTEDLTV